MNKKLTFLICILLYCTSSHTTQPAEKIEPELTHTQRFNQSYIATKKEVADIFSKTQENLQEAAKEMAKAEADALAQKMRFHLKQGVRTTTNNVLDFVMGPVKTPNNNHQVYRPHNPLDDFTLP